MRYGILYILLLVGIGSFAQRIEKVCGEYTYHAPENVSLEQARQTALERAKTGALAEKFGTTVTQQNTTVVKNENEKSDISFLSLGGSEVKGEWIETIGKTEYDVFYEQGMLVVKCSVCGKAREIVGAGVDFTAKIMNSVKSKYTTNNFYDGEDIFLAFRSPVDGYLAVYLIDESKTAFCLLPYSGDPQGKTPVKAGKDYIFFSQKHVTPEESRFVTEYILTADKQVEQNFLYIIFSPNEFTKANDAFTGEVLMPRELSFTDFQQWLAKNRQKDKDMKVETKVLIIRK
jgi:hypothetical protein